MTITEAELANMTYGCELEYEGISRETAARTVAPVVGGTVRYDGGSYDTWVTIAPDGRVWKAVSDGSLRGMSAEVVTPILKLADMETLQRVVRALRAAHAEANERT